MDDFLHNLRSGNLRKPGTGTRRQYGDPQSKHPNRRVNDRRRRDEDQRLAAESMETIKGVLEQLTAAQQELALAQKKRADADARTAKALERIAASLEMRSGAAMLATTAAQALPSTPPEPPKLSLGEKISKLRDQKLSYARIADQLNQEGISTPSGRGQWRGTSVQRVLQRHNESGV
jgi:hypothetical protein